MTTELSDTELAALKARVAASNRAFGRVLSIIGAVLAGLALIILIGGGLAILIGGGLALTGLDAAARDGASTGDTAGAIAGVLGFAPALLILFAMCGLVAGEQMRRGGIVKNANPPRTRLPTATHISRFTVMSYRWHTTWLVVGLVVSFVLVGLPVLSWFTGGWPSNVSDGYAFDGFWIIYESIAFGVTIACAVSLLKKALFVRAIGKGLASRAGGPGKRFWRWVDYRWRFDLWVAGIGGLGIVLAFTFLRDGVGPAGDTAALVPFVLVLACGVVLIALGAVAAAQFWRSGEELGTGESAA